MNKKAVIFVEANDKVLKKKFREGKRATLYRADTFGSLSLELSRGKLYDYEEGGEYGIINGKIPGDSSFFRWCVNNLVTLSNNIKEDTEKIVEDNPFYGDKVYLGFVLVNESNGDVLRKEYLYEMTWKNKSFELDITYLSKQLKRERELNKILEE